MRPTTNLARARYETRQARPIRNFEYNLRKLKKCQYLYLADTGQRGVGVFAAKRFRRGDVVMMDFDGDYFDQVLTYRDLQELKIDLSHPLQVDLDAFRIPSGSIDDFTNHSCDPSTGIRLFPRGTIVMAIRDIKVHDEITFDYSTYLNNPYERMVCHCGATCCRGVIGNFRTLPEDLQQRYLALGIVGDFALAQDAVEDTG